MAKSTKVLLLLGTALILIGVILYLGVMNMLGWDFGKLSTIQYETNTYEISEQVLDIDIRTNTADITLVATQEQEVKVVCYEQQKSKHNVSAEDGKLRIELHDQRKWYEKIGINFKTSSITVYLPQGQLGMLEIRATTGDVKIDRNISFAEMDVSLNTGDVTNHASVTGALKIEATTGDIFVKELSASACSLSTNTGNIEVADVQCSGEVKIHVSTGDVSVKNVTCGQFVSAGTTGDVHMVNVISSMGMDLERSTGDIVLDRCDGQTLKIRVTTGDVRGSLLSNKIFAVKTGTGKIDVPSVHDGGLCEITTSTGNITFTIAQ